ncbi:MAG: rhomboid family intramembrane serine protease [Candidatus Thalassarchaeaceae archaeon]|nr:rhomboid family intramembrane serine protease [Candidatus Thalassarchaeaceae archaeon]
MGQEVPILPLYWPWTDTERRVLTTREFLRTRSFSLIYLSGIITIWATLGFGHWGSLRCETLGEQLACSSAIWPNKLIDAPHEYLLSFFTSPWFHNDLPHIKFVIISFAIFTQSFEAKAGTKSTASLFFGTIAFTSIIAGIIFNTGAHFWPESEIFTHPMKRSWMGGSIGLMGILGALSHHSKWKWLIPAILLSFEYWNREYNGISEYITWGHLSSALFGFVVWGIYLKRNTSISLVEKNKSTRPEG